MFSVTHSNRTGKTSTIARLSGAMLLAGAMLTSSVAIAEENPPPRPSAQELAILRGLLGLRPVQQAATVAAPAPSTEVSNPATGTPALPPATPKSSTAPAGDSPVMSDAGVEGTSGYNVSRAMMAARMVSQRMQLASR